MLRAVLTGRPELTIALLVACLFYLLPQGRAADAGALEPRVSKSSFESDGKPIKVERFDPPTAGKHPAVLIIHGVDGFLFAGKQYRDLGRDLARRGYVAFLVHYFDRTGTLYSDRKTVERHFLTWLRVISDALQHAGKQDNVDPRRLGLIGVSLGAYLSLSLATQDPRIRAVVDLFGGIPDQFAERLTRLPPVLILHGEQDRIVSVEEARKLERLLKERNLPYQIKIYAGQGHGFKGDDLQDALQRTLEFFDRQLRSGVAATTP